MGERHDETAGLIAYPRKLRGELFYLVVFGPGYGESIALRVPPDLWIVVDSLTVEPRPFSPTIAMLREHRARWSAVVLSHPHDDHAAGLRALLDIQDVGIIGCVAPYVHPPAEWRDSEDLELHLKRGEVEDALSAIQYRWERDQTARWELLSGDVRSFGEARLCVLHPSREEVDAAMKQAPPNDPNSLASPLLVEWKDLRLVLGSDLPRKGWRKVAERHEALDLARHQVFKVAHHGSKGALHEIVLKNASRSRCWLATPFHRNKGLPCFDDDHGVAGLLGYNDEIALTSLRDVSGSGARPWRLTRQQIRDARAKARGSSSLGKRVLALPRPGMDPAGWIAVGFAADGTIADRQYGDGAVRIVDDPGAGAAAKRSAKAKKRGKRAARPHR